MSALCPNYAYSLPDVCLIVQAHSYCIRRETESVVQSLESM